MSGKNRAARRRAERKHGGPPPNYWNDYRRELQIGIAVLVLAVLATGFLVVRARQSTQSEIDAYCEVYDQTHEDMLAATSSATSTTTSTPGTTIAADPAAGTTVPAATAAAVPGSTPPGSIAEAGTSTTVPDITTRLKSAVEKRSNAGPKKVRDAWAAVGKALNSTKLTASQQNEVQAARVTVNDFAKNECHKDPADF